MNLTYNDIVDRNESKIRTSRTFETQVSSEFNSLYGSNSPPAKET